MAGHQVGHLRRNVAAALAPLMDEANPLLRPRIEALLPYAVSHAFSAPVLLTFSGVPEAERAVNARLAQHGIRLTAEPARAAPARMAVSR